MLCKHNVLKWVHKWFWHIHAYLWCITSCTDMKRTENVANNFSKLLKKQHGERTRVKKYNSLLLPVESWPVGRDDIVSQKSCSTWLSLKFYLLISAVLVLVIMPMCRGLLVGLHLVISTVPMVYGLEDLALIHDCINSFFKQWEVLTILCTECNAHNHQAACLFLTADYN